MKVMLKQDVKAIGKKDEIHEVSDGYARNFLFPRGLAVSADASALNMIKTKQQAKDHHDSMALAAAQEIADKINNKQIDITAKAGQNGRLFGAVTTKEIAAKLTQICGSNIDKRKVVLDADIKSFGTYTVDVKIHVGVVAKVTINVKE